MSDIKGQLIKNSYNYVLQSDLISGIVYRIGGDVPTNPKFISGLTVNTNFTYSNGSEFPGYVLTCDASGNGVWAPVSGTTSGVVITGGTYSAGTATFTNNTGGTFSVTGFSTLQYFVTGSTPSGMTLNNGDRWFDTTTGDELVWINDGNSSQWLQICCGGGGILVGDYLPLSGGTVTGATNFTNGLTANTISATTYQNLPTDIRVTGATYSNNTFTYTNNTGGTFNVLFNTVTGLTVNGNLTVTGTTSSGTISATTYQNLPISGLTAGQNISITGSNGNFTVSVTGVTSGSNFTGGTVSGATNFTGGLTANTISATTYQNLPTDIRVTGATYSNNTFTYTNNTGGTFNVLFNTVTGLTVNGNLTVTGNTSVQGLTATTISATTYLNLPTNISDSYIFSSNNSDIGGYEQMVILPLFVPNAIASIVTTVSTSPTLLANFATNLNYPNTTVIPSGFATIHFETQKNTGSNGYECFAELYKRNLAGTETLIGTSDFTTVIATNTVIQQTVTVLLPNNVTILTTDRIVVKIYANVISGANRNITLFYDDATNSRLQLPVTSVSIAGLVPYTGATTNVNLGSNSLIANTISATTYQNLPATPFLPLSGGTINGNVIVNGTGQRAISSFVSNSGTSQGIFTYATNGTNAYGVYSVASPGEFESITEGIGGYFASDDSQGYANPTNRYSVQLVDGTEGVGKVLTSVTSDGKANWVTPRNGGSDLYLFYNY
jgi:hypothetical protein